jgi:hypothetical protein
VTTLGRSDFRQVPQKKNEVQEMDKGTVLEVYRLVKLPAQSEHIAQLE